MNNSNAAKPTNVKELFAPLGERLFEFESGRYHNDVGFYAFEIDEVLYTSRSDIVANIGKQAYLFDSADVYEEALLYVPRIKAVLDALEPPAFQYIEYDTGDGSGIEKTPTTDKDKQELVDGYRRVLNTYLKDLDSIIKFRKGHITSKPSPETIKPQPQQMSQSFIQLPENFTVTQLNKHFDPQLSVNQAALFLHYLREQAVLPPYSNSSIGTLAEAFFVRNQKNITKGLTDIYSIKESKEDLNALKGVLQALIKQIDADLKEAR